MSDSKQKENSCNSLDEGESVLLTEAEIEECFEHGKEDNDNKGHSNEVPKSSGPKTLGMPTKKILNNEIANSWERGFYMLINWLDSSEKHIACWSVFPTKLIIKDEVLFTEEYQRIMGSSAEWGSIVKLLRSNGFEEVVQKDKGNNTHKVYQHKENHVCQDTPFFDSKDHSDEIPKCFNPLTYGSTHRSNNAEYEEVPRFNYGSHYGLGWASNNIEYVHDPEGSAVEEVARFNYETYHNLPRGTASMLHIQCSSAGITGWASCVIQNDERPSSKRQRSEGLLQRDLDEKDGKKKVCLSDEIIRPRSDEEENKQLRLALLESLGVNTSKANSAPETIESPEVEGEVSYYSDSSEDEASYGSDSRKEEFLHDSESSKDVDEEVRCSCENNKDTESETKIVDTNQDSKACAVLQLEKYNTQDERESSFECVDVGTESSEDPKQTNSPNNPQKVTEKRVKVTQSEQQKTDPSKTDGDAEICNESNESQDDFVVVDVKPKINRTSWQWSNLLKNLEKKTTKDEASEAETSSECSSSEWSLV